MKDYSRIDHFSKVFYTEDKGRHRPYIDIAFSNAPPGQVPDAADYLISPKAFGLIDSGADHTAIPFSIGKSIGLAPLQEGEKTIIVSGIGGSIHCVERACTIFMANNLKREIYKFDETVWWKVPSEEIEQTLKGLTEKLNANIEPQKQALADTNLFKHFQVQIDQIKGEIIAINSTLEGGVLVGRPFFNNFEFIQFNHNDRENEHKCFFNYKVKKKKIAQIIPF
jgi:hypothetical protein